MIATPPWRPLLEGELADRARAAAHDIVEAIIAHVQDAQDARLTPELVPNLAGGSAGLAVLLAYVDRATDSDHGDLIHDLLAHSVTAVSERPMLPTLYGGLTGIAWALDHLSDQLDDDDDPVADVDEVLVDALSQPTWPGHFDVVSGLTGLAVYALARMPRPAAAECLRRVVDYLDALSTRPPGAADQRTWLTAPTLLPPWQAELAPEGQFDLGAAHGSPGPIYALARIAEAGVSADKARALAEAGVRWMHAQALPDQPHARYPGTINPLAQAPPSPTRSAWCYGDPGVAAVLFRACQALDRPDWRDRALATLRGAIARPDEDAGVVDTPLCHGATGLAHIFNRLFRATGDRTLGDAATAWFARALDMRDPDRGFGGFPSAGREDDQIVWHDSLSLLDGAAGVALALTAATSSIEPAWDCLLLLS